MSFCKCVISGNGAVNVVVVVVVVVVVAVWGAGGGARMAQW